jgi:hypothetical protein
MPKCWAIEDQSTYSIACNIVYQLNYDKLLFHE